MQHLYVAFKQPVHLGEDALSSLDNLGRPQAICTPVSARVISQPRSGAVVSGTAGAHKVVLALYESVSDLPLGTPETDASPTPDTRPRCTRRMNTGTSKQMQGQRYGTTTMLCDSFRFSLVFQRRYRLPHSASFLAKQPYINPIASKAPILDSSKSLSRW